MGVCVSNSKVAIIQPSTQYSKGRDVFYTVETLKEYELLGLSEMDVEHFVDVFLVLKPDEVTVTVPIKNIVYLLDIESSSHVMALVFNKLASVKSNAGLTFREFVVFSWKFLSMSNTELIDFAFDCLSVGAESGLMTNKSLLAGVIAVHGDYSQNYSCESSIYHLMKLINESENGSLDRSVFRDTVRHIAALVMPIFNAYSKMREAIFGIRFWQLREVQAVRIKREPAVVDLMSRIHVFSISRQIHCKENARSCTSSVGECDFEDDSTVRVVKTVAKSSSTRGLVTRKPSDQGEYGRSPSYHKVSSVLNSQYNSMVNSFDDSPLCTLGVAPLNANPH